MSPEPTTSGATAPPTSGHAAVRYDVNELLKGGREAIIEHNGAEYRLRITSNGRLILTK
jgi:hemin uptake protein HemP